MEKKNKTNKDEKTPENPKGITEAEVHKVLRYCEVSCVCTYFVISDIRF